MKKIPVKKSFIDASFFSFLSILMIPSLIIGVPAIALLLVYFVVVASYASLRESNKAATIASIILFPFVTVLFAFLFQKIIWLNPMDVIEMWFSGIGLAMMITTIAAVLLAKKIASTWFSKEIVEEENEEVVVVEK